MSSTALNRVWLASLLATGLCCASAASAAETERPTESLAAAARAIVLEGLPDVYEKSDGWGETTDAFDGLNFDHRAGRLRISKRKKQVRHGLWKQYRIVPVEPAERLQLRIENVRRGNVGQTAFTVFLQSRVAVWARVERWRHGVKLLNFTIEGQADVEVRLDCELAIRTAAGSVLPDVIVDPLITGADVRLIDVELDRISKLDGDAVHELGDSLRHTLENYMQEQAPKAVEKANRAIDKRRDRLRFSPSEWLEQRWLGQGVDAPRQLGTGPAD